MEEMLRLSRVRLGKNVRFQGIPAILFGVACVIVAARSLPETLRQARELWNAVGGERRELNP